MSLQPVVYNRRNLIAFTESEFNARQSALKNINEDTPTAILSTLDERSRRRVDRISRQLEVAGFRNVHIVQARTPESEDFAKHGLPSHFVGRWQSDLRHLWGTAACAVSHLEFLKTDQSQLPMMVFEDDVMVDPGFFEYLNAIDFPEGVDWDICHLSYWNANLSSERNPHGKLTESLMRCRHGECAGMYSYILNHPVHDRILPIYEEIDFHLSRCVGEVKTYVIEHIPWLTSPDFDTSSVREEMDSESWAQNNRSGT